MEEWGAARQRREELGGIMLKMREVEEGEKRDWKHGDRGINK